MSKDPRDVRVYLTVLELAVGVFDAAGFMKTMAGMMLPNLLTPWTAKKRHSVQKYGVTKSRNRNLWNHSKQINTRWGKTALFVAPSEAAARTRAFLCYSNGDSVFLETHLEDFIHAVFYWLAQLEICHYHSAVDKVLRWRPNPNTTLHVCMCLDH